MCRRPDNRAAHGRHAAAVRIGRDGRERRVGQHPAKQGKAPRPVFAEPTAQKGTVRLPAQTFSRETAKASARKQGQLLCKNVPVQKRWTRCPAKRRPALRGTRKSIRKRPDCAISRRAIRACPGVTFRRLRRFFFAFHTDIALRRMPVPFFHDAGNNAPSKARYNRYRRCNLRSPDRTARQRPAQKK